MDELVVHRHDKPAKTGRERLSQTGLWVLTRQASVQVDALAAEQLGVPSIVLMENASLGLCERVIELQRTISENDSVPVVILAGPGNNGGDGFALARHLHNRAIPCTIIAVSDPKKHTLSGGDAATNLAIAQAMNIPVVWDEHHLTTQLEAMAGNEPAVVVDAMLGTGLRSSPRQPIGGAGSVIELVNRLREENDMLRVLAVDVPTGLDCDTGMPAGTDGKTDAADRNDDGLAIRADETVTFVAPKVGYLQLSSQAWTGQVWVADIGIGRGLVRRLGQWRARTRPGETAAVAQHGQNLPDAPASHGRVKH